MLSPVKIAIVCGFAAYGVATIVSSRAPAPAEARANVVQQAGPASTTLYADSRGHFSSKVSVNGTLVDALVDTGATTVVLSWEDAERAGLKPSPNAPKGMAATANGNVTYSKVRIPEVRLNGLLVRDVEAGIMPKGAMKGTLLGMSFLSRLSKVEMQSGRLVLAQ